MVQTAQWVLTEVHDGVATVTLNRARSHNALTMALMQAVIDAFKRLGADPGVRAILLKADGPAFSIGGDMHAFRAHLSTLRDYAHELVGKLNEMILTMIDVPQPVLAAVHGVVTGGSLGLLLGSDIVLVSDKAAFKAHYATAGFSPDGGWSIWLPQVIGPKRAAECLLLNRTITAQEAVAWGLAGRLVDQGALDAEANKLGRKLAAYPMGSLRSSKELLRKDKAELAANLERERQAFVQQVQQKEARNGVMAFLESFKDYPRPEA